MRRKTMLVLFVFLTLPLFGCNKDNRPRKAIYHYLEQGKEELIEETIEKKEEKNEINKDTRLQELIDTLRKNNKGLIRRINEFT
jgi:DNA-binding PadR family transcriptional regulator